MVLKAEGCFNDTQLLEKIKTWQPQVVFIGLTTGNGAVHDFSICRQINSTHKNTFIAVISNGINKDIKMRAYQNGAKAFFDKSVEALTLCKFLNAFSLNAIKEYYTAEVLSKNRTCKPEPEHSALSILTKREREIMELIVQGNTHKQIEWGLKITHETYKTHHRHILQKLDLKNDVALLRFAMANNLYAESFNTQPAVSLQIA